MLFNSYAFAIFLPIVLVVYYSVGTRSQNLWLLVASWVFYGWWDYRFLGLLALSTIVDFYCGRAIDAASKRNHRKLLLLASVGTNLTILGFFKYFNFFVGSAVELLQFLGMPVTPVLLQIILPVGISFYTFQTMSYTIDIYRGHARPCDNIVTFALYVAYFPQLVAGPIERSTRLLPQLSNPRRVTGASLHAGMILIVVGLFKKVGVADAIAPLVDARFAFPKEASSPDLLAAVYLFAIQIYCDFSGYSSIARGVSQLLGIELMVNFAQPYFSTSITEFWRRWHISLSTWLRDYLYIPLGGNRGGPVATYRNLLATMLLGGLWHGASWNYVIWGGLHGVYLISHRRFRKPERPFSWRLTSATVFFCKMALVFHLVCLTWIFFRAASLSTALNYIGGILSFQGTGTLEQINWLSGRLIALIVPLLAIDILQYRARDPLAIRHFRWPLQAIVLAVLATLTLALGGIDEAVPFIYFQF